MENQIVTVEILGIKRNKRLARINISPFNYNPVKNQLKVYTNIQVELEFANANFHKTKSLIEKTSSYYFKSSEGVINNKAFESPLLTSSQPLKMVILRLLVCDNLRVSFLYLQVAKQVRRVVVAC